LTAGDKLFLDAVGSAQEKAKRCRGPAVVLIPSGEGDCASFESVADARNAVNR